MPVVMLVDDEIGALKLMGIMLERGGFGVVEVRDAGQCLDCVDDVEPDLIITDIMMPGMNGIDLCKILRLRIGTRATPILILSARGDAESIIHGVEAGATDYLHKPILHHELLSKIREILSNTSVMPHIDWETAQHERRLQRLFQVETRIENRLHLLNMLCRHPWIHTHENHLFDIVMRLTSDPIAEMRAGAVYKLPSFKNHVTLRQSLYEFLNDTSHEVIVAATSALSTIVDEADIEWLIEKLNDTSPFVREAVVISLGTIGNERVLNPLIRMLRDSVATVQIATVQMLQKYDKAQVLSPLIDAFPNAPLEVRISIVKAMNYFDNSSQVYDFLIQAIKDRGAEVRLEAIRISSRFEFSLASRLVRLCLKDKSINVCLACIEVLENYSDNDIYDILGEVLYDSRIIIKLAVIKLLGDQKSTRAIELLLPILNNRSKTIRIAVTNALGHRHFDDDVPYLKRALFEGENDVRIAIIGAMINKSLDLVLEPIVNCLENSQSRVRLAAINTLGTYRDERVITYLVNSLQDRNVHVRVAAINALAQQDAQMVIKQLEVVAKSKDAKKLLEALNSAQGSHFSKSLIVSSLMAQLVHEDERIRGNAVIRLAELRHEDEQFLRSSPAQDIFWRNVSHSLGSLTLLEAKRRWGSMSAIAVAFTKTRNQQDKQLLDLIKITQDIGARTIILRALGLNHVVEALPILMSAASASEREVRLAAIEALGNFGQKSPVNVIGASLKDSSLSVRFAAVHALALVGSKKSVAILKRELSYGEAAMRVDIAKVIVEPDSQVTKRTAIRMLLKAIEVEADETVLRSLAFSLRQFNTPKSILALESLMTHWSALVREAASESLEVIKNA